MASEDKLLIKSVSCARISLNKIVKTRFSFRSKENSKIAKLKTAVKIKRLYTIDFVESNRQQDRKNEGISKTIILTINSKLHHI